MQLNEKYTRVNSFANRNSILVDTTWETYKSKWTLERIFSTIKWEADAILIESDINNFSFIKQKDKIIYDNKTRILYKLLKRWTINESEQDYNLLQEYIKQWFIDIDEIKEIMIIFFKSKLFDIFIKAKSPLIWSGYWHKKIIIQNYHDLDHDLLKNEQLILSYWIKNKLLSQVNIDMLENISIKWWDTLNYFCDSHYDENLVDSYLKKIWIKV